MINKEQLMAKTQFFSPFNNPGIKSWVNDNETFVGFSPKFIIIENTLIAYISK